MTVQPHAGWRGMVQTKLKHLKTGSTVENRFRSEDKLEKAHLEQHEMEYLYNDGTEYHFMNSETYEQVALSAEILGDNVYYLIPNIKLMVEYYNDAPVGIDPPKVVELKVVDTAPNMRGATVTASQKPATRDQPCRKRAAVYRRRRVIRSIPRSSIWRGLSRKALSEILRSPCSKEQGLFL